MKICADGHDEVCHDERKCPMCELLKINSDLEDEIYTLKEEIDTLEKEGR